MRNSQKQQQPRPLFRVTFSSSNGKDEDGRDILTRPREIGAIWPRKNGKTGGILMLDIMPVELTRRQGVVFILPVDDEPKGNAR